MSDAELALARLEVLLLDSGVRARKPLRSVEFVVAETGEIFALDMSRPGRLIERGALKTPPAARVRASERLLLALVTSTAVEKAPGEVFEVSGDASAVAAIADALTPPTDPLSLRTRKR
jgi:hypothetical protein